MSDKIDGMQEIPTSLRVRGFIGCNYVESCKSKMVCERIHIDSDIAEVIVHSDESDLKEAVSDLRVKIGEWEDIHEEACIRRDNFLNGNRIPVNRIASCWIEPIYGEPGDIITTEMRV